MKIKSFLRAFVLVVSLLLTSHFSLMTVYAASAPNPQPCKNPETTELVDNYLMGDNGKPTIVLNYQVSGKEGDEKLLDPKSFNFTVNFSKLQAVFGPSNSNYLEGNFQSDQHRQDNLLGFDSVKLDAYNGPLQKSSPSVLLDTQKVNYVKYITEVKPTLPEAANKYTDIEGNGNPKTIYDLVQEFGAPNPPTLSQQQQQNDSWNSTWGKYWAKIPTTWSEFYKAKLDFRPVVGDEDLKKIRDGQMCPIPIRNVEVNFVMPEFFRTTAISDQINRLLAPKSAQSYQDHGILSSPTPKSTQNTIPSAVQNFFSYCWKLITNPSSLAKQIQKTTSFMIDPKNFLIKPVLAATQNLDDTSCIKITKNAKSGQAPYCPLPTEEKARLGNAVSCSDQNDNFKLEKDNPNVICTFTFSTPTLLYVINPKDKNDDDSKVCTLDQSTQNYQCNIKVYVIPDFRIPWLSAIWNDTLYSDKNENAPYQNETGRPGIYTFFTPVSLQDPLRGKDPIKVLQYCNSGGGDADPLCKKLADYFKECAQSQTSGNFGDVLLTCIEKALFRLPGLVTGASAQDAKQRFVGGVDCSKHFVRDIALKPLELQKSQNIQSDCTLASSSSDDGGGGGGTVTPGTGCKSGSTFSSLLPNPIPASAGAVSPQIFQRLDTGNVIPAAKAAESQTGTPCELLVGLDYVESSWSDSGSFISGRTIGTVETDVPSASACTSYGGTWNDNPGGCIFRTLEQTAIYAGDHIKDKVALISGQQRPPQNFNEMVGAMSYYNGGGNANCGKGVAYSGPCPPPDGIDDPYAMSHFDNNHTQMYLIFCSDFTRCDPPQRFQRDGAATAAKEFFTRPRT